MKLKRWVEIQDDGKNYLLDMEFLMSGFQCSFGNGCKGIHGEPDIGCCAIGVPLSKEEVEELEGRIAQLTPDDWQNHGAKKWKKRRRGDKDTPYNTFVVRHEDGVEGCVFANRSSFSAGAGCAFHLAALRRGERPIDWKPDTCWQVPITFHDSEEFRATIIRMNSRTDWTGGYEDREFIQWFCYDDEISWGSSEPVFRTLAEEFKEICGEYSPTLYQRFVTVCEYYWANMPKPESKPVPVTLTVKP